MDSPWTLLHLGFLLLAAPHPNIAMSIVGRAEGMEDHYTEVKVYLCRGCNSCVCKSGANDFEKFEIIADAQNETLSDGIIELVTNKANITVCFEEPNSCPEGTYGIFWQKPRGSGLPCGKLSSGENGGGHISTEKKTICCEAQTDTRKHSPYLKCFYTQKSRPKPNTLPVVFPDEGIPDGASSFVWCSRGSSWLGTRACFTWMLCFLLLCSL